MLVSLSFCEMRECIQRTAGGAEMPPGEMQIDRRFLQVAMPEQHLDGAQVGTGFEQMSGKAVAQSVGMDALVLKTGAFGGVLTGSPEDLGGDRITCGMPSVAGKQPLRGLAPQPAPVDAQRIEQLRAEHDIAVLASLAAPDMNDHPLAVDIADLQVRHFCATCARGIQRHQQDAMKGELCRVDQTRDFFLAEYLREGAAPSSDTASRQCSSRASTPEYRRSAKRANRRITVFGTELQLREQHRLILANMLRAKLIGWTMEVPAEMLNPCRYERMVVLGEVAAPQLLKHDLT